MEKIIRIPHILLIRIPLSIFYSICVLFFWFAFKLSQHLVTKRKVLLNKKQKILNGVSFIIPTWNKKDMVLKCLKLLDKAIENTLLPTEIIIIDNNSIDGTSEALNKLKLKSPVIVLTQPTNIGFAKAINLGSQKAKYNYIYLLNNDMEVNQSFFQNILKVAKFTLKHETFFGITSQIFFYDPSKRREESGKTYMNSKFGHIKIAHYINQNNLNNHSITLYPGGGSSLINKHLFEYFGGYDSKTYKPFYCEDLDLGFTFWKKGFPSYYCPDSKVIHHHQSSTRSLKYPPSHFLEQNLVSFQLKHIDKTSEILWHIAYQSVYTIMRRDRYLYLLHNLSILPQIFAQKMKLFSTIDKYSYNQISQFTQFENVYEKK